MQSSSRNGAKVIWLAVHTTEGIMRAAALRDWTSWAGSSHASCDETGVLLTPEHGFVPYDRAAWTLRNGNPISENIEQCGWARWTRAEWLARPKLLDATARWLADRHKARPWIPLRRLTDAEIRARVPGVLGHGDYTRATGDGTHTDPGPNYPWDVVLDKARAYAAPDPIRADLGDPDMRIIQQKDRGIAVVGPGYYKGLSPDELHAAGALYGAPVIFDNAVDWDRAVSVATGGESVLDAPIQRNEQAGGGVTTLRAQTHWADYNLRTVVPEAVAKVVGTPDVDALAAKLGETLQGKTSITRADVKSAVQEALREGTGDPAPGPVA